MSTFHSLAISIGLSLVCAMPAGAQAAYKCIGTDGKTTYQALPCPAVANSSIVNTSPSLRDGEADENSWRFWRYIDQITGATACRAASPAFDLMTSSGHWFNAQLIYEVSTAEESINARVESGKVFHHAFAGSVLKVGTIAYPFTRRPEQRYMTVSPIHTKLVADAMADSPTLQMRVRLWPWDEFITSRPAQFTGFRQARALAMQCAGRPVNQ